MDINCLIVDDDIISIEVIKSYIEGLKDFKLIDVCYDAISAFDIVQEKEIDLIFLDIEMPKLSGIEFIKNLRTKREIKFIIITGTKDYAVESYELEVLDYILKPLHFERFFKALNKYYSLISKSINHVKFTPDILTSDTNPFIYVKENKKIIKLYLKDILFVESIKNYIRIVATYKSVITKQSITYFEEVLPIESFIRIHRSYIVSIAKIEAFTAVEIEIGNKELPIGRSYKKSVFKSLNFFENL
jgi:DNA-binding LytR/AlgR family response regulator